VVGPTESLEAPQHSMHHIFESRYDMWYVDPLLGNDCEISNYISVVTRQRWCSVVVSCYCEKLVAEVGGPFENPEEGERPSL
jgi:hypothetical protein